MYVWHSVKQYLLWEAFTIWIQCCWCLLLIYLLQIIEFLLPCWVCHKTGHEVSSHNISVQIGDSLEEFLVEATSDVKLRQVMMSLSEAIRTIAFKVRMASVSIRLCIDNFIAKIAHKRQSVISWLSWINIWGRICIAKSYIVWLERWKGSAILLVWRYHCDRSNTGGLAFFKIGIRFSPRPRIFSSHRANMREREREREREIATHWTIGRSSSQFNVKSHIMVFFSINWKTNIDNYMILYILNNFCIQVRTASCAGSACINSFGDEQLAVDLLADKLLFEALKYSVSSSFNSSYHYLPSLSCPLILNIIRAICFCLSILVLHLSSLYCLGILGLKPILPVHLCATSARCTLHTWAKTHWSWLHWML